MLRNALICLVLGGWVASAAAQTRPIQWISNFDGGVSKAQRTNLPLMLYVTSSSSEDDSDLKKAQQRTFRDPLVTAIAGARFVPVRLVRNTQTKQLLEQMGETSDYGNYLVYATPDGQSLGHSMPGELGNARALATKLTDMFRKYRSLLFTNQLKPVLEDKAAKPKDLLTALQVIETNIITDADKTVIELLDREGLAKNVLKKAYDALAVLSTPEAVKAMHERALKGDRMAQQALQSATPDAAVKLLEVVETTENIEEFMVAYEALLKIGNIKERKSENFWINAPPHKIDEEISGLSERIRRVIQDWQQGQGKYR